LRDDANQTLLHALSSDSVVLITGAATHLGSQLAIALYYTYNVSQLILIDELGSNDIYLPTNHLMNLDGAFEEKPTDAERKRSEKSLASFEIKRQRIFHVMQTVKERGFFYKVDFRPQLPEYSETKTETLSTFSKRAYPVLDMIFQKFDITHVVHLDDEIMNPNVTRIISRKKEDDRMGMMEGLLDQLRINRDRKGTLPHFVYGSSSEIYDDSVGEKREDWDVSFTPQHSARGVSKLLNEVLAMSYNDLYNIFSVGLRFFEVYGPWSSPGTSIFEYAERAVNPDVPILATNEIDLYSTRDYIYIDDAIDATMAAMQFCSPIDENVVINVGTGKGRTIPDIAFMFESFSPRRNKKHQMANILDSYQGNSKAYSTRIASTERASYLLGLEPQVTLSEGIKRTLAWHNDRSHPFQDPEDDRGIGDAGIQSCHPTDLECLNGLTVFPCASECARSNLCQHSVFDNIIHVSRSITRSCKVVMYTIDLEKNANSITSSLATMSASREQIVSSVSGSFCNIAFVAEGSDLMVELKQRVGISSEINVEDMLVDMIQQGREIKESDMLRYGWWTILPLSPTNIEFDRLLPKLSPGSFFSSKYAIFINPNSSIKDTNHLMNQFHMKQGDNQGSTTAMMLGIKNSQVKNRRPRHLSASLYIQEKMYNSIRIALQEHLDRRGNIDSSWMVHSLESDGAKGLRCDIHGEVLNWNVTEVDESIDFILSLHDFWNSALARWKGQGRWWKADKDKSAVEKVAILSRRERAVVQLVPNDLLDVIVIAQQ
jgi:Nucleoside-diphosphate-sugar epimerases